MQSARRDRAEGAWDQAKGKAKEVAGKVTGDRKLQAKGKLDQAKGKAKRATGRVKRAAQGIKKDIKKATG